MSGLDELSREELIAIVLEQRQQICDLQAEVETLRSQLGQGKGNSVPAFIKPSRQHRRAEEGMGRKKRTKSFARLRDIPTEEVKHVVEKCPDCGRRLSGGWVHDRRQVIEIPETPIRIIEHILIARRCGVCGKVHIPNLGVAEGVLGKQRVGVGLMSLVATLSIANRIPQRMVQRLLMGLYGVHISVGEISGILRKVGECSEGAVQSILREIRGSPNANADETGWREDGDNGYLWSVSIPNARYFEFDHSRASAVIQRILGYCFCGVLGCDFYGAYNFYSGPIQRCWVHMLRDLKKLAEAHSEDRRVLEWVELVKGVYQMSGKIAKRGFAKDVRVRLRQELETRLLATAQPYLTDKTAPQHVLAKRIDRHLGELFTFVQYPGCPSGNNAAERAIRPAVIARKVSGGTRSPNGSKTRTNLMTVFGTWTVQGKDLMKSCREMIISSRTQSQPTRTLISY